jgi:hypothetical protein
LECLTVDFHGFIHRLYGSATSPDDPNLALGCDSPNLVAISDYFLSDHFGRALSFSAFGGHDLMPHISSLEYVGIRLNRQLIDFTLISRAIKCSDCRRSALMTAKYLASRCADR